MDSTNHDNPYASPGHAESRAGTGEHAESRAGVKQHVGMSCARFPLGVICVLLAILFVLNFVMMARYGTPARYGNYVSLSFPTDVLAILAFAILAVGLFVNRSKAVMVGLVLLCIFSIGVVVPIGEMASRIIKTLVRPHVLCADLDAQYREMARDEAREAEAVEWSEATLGDIANEVR